VAIGYVFFDVASAINLAETEHQEIARRKGADEFGVASDTK
jgi:hypothetical protein